MTIKETQELRAQRLNAVIEKSGLSYPELEKLTGISKSSLQRYATGATKKIPIDCLEKLAKVLNLDPAYLVFGEDSSPFNMVVGGNKIFDNRLKQLREARGLTMRQAAADLDIPYTTYVHYEKDENEANSTALVKMALYYGVSTDYLLGLPTRTEKDSPLNSEREALNSLINNLPTEQINDVCQFMEFLVWKEKQE